MIFPNKILRVFQELRLQFIELKLRKFTFFKQTGKFLHQFLLNFLIGAFLFTLFSLFLLDQLSLTNFFPFFELPTASAFVELLLARHALNEKINLRILVPPIRDVELANLSISAVDNQRVFGVVWIEIVIVRSFTGSIFSATGHDGHSLLSQAEFFKQIQIGDASEAAGREGGGEGDGGLCLWFYFRLSLVVL